MAYLFDSCPDMGRRMPLSGYIVVVVRVYVVYSVCKPEWKGAHYGTPDVWGFKE